MLNTTLSNLSNDSNNCSIITTSILTNNSIGKYTSANCQQAAVITTNATTTNCIQCWHIENTLLNDLSSNTIASTIIVNDLKKYDNKSNSKNVETLTEIITQQQQPQQQTAIENVWQVDDVQSNPPKIHYNNTINLDEKSIKSEIDTTSFIILRDDDDVNANEIAEKTNNSLEPISATNESISNNQNTNNGLSSSHSKCDDCCYCNPNLHRNTDPTSEKICNFCKLRKSNTPPQTASSSNPRQHIIKDEPETKSTSTNTNHSIPEQHTQRGENIYEESVTKKDHTHVRTKSKDSDTVSLKCTKINSKIRRFIPEDLIDANMFPPPQTSNNNNNKKSGNKQSASRQQTQNQDLTDFLKNHTKTPDLYSPKIWPPNSHRTKFDEQNHNKSSTCVRLPSPFAVISSPHNYDSSHSSDCSTTSSSNSSKNDQHKNEILPQQDTRWHQTNSIYQQHQQQKQAKGRSSRYHDFYGNNDNENKIVNNNEVLTTAVNKRVNQESTQSAVFDKNQSKLTKLTNIFFFKSF